LKHVEFDNHHGLWIVFHKVHLLVDILIAILRIIAQMLYRLKIEIAGYWINTLRTGDADLRFYITTVQDG